MKLLFLGAPGAGKGTQEEILGRLLSIPTISTGNILRAAMKEGTEVGLKAKSYVESGKLVPDDVIIDIIKEKTGKEALDAFNEAMENIMPKLEVKARRVGGANYQVPIEIRPERRQTLAIRWLVINTRKRSEREMAKRLAAELMDAYNNTGGTVKKKEDTHRMAEANKAFAHFRF